MRTLIRCRACNDLCTHCAESLTLCAHTVQIIVERRATPINALEAKDAALTYREEWRTMEVKKMATTESARSSVLCAARVRSLEVFWRYQRIWNPNKPSVACERAYESAVLIHFSLCPVNGPCIERVWCRTSLFLRSFFFCRVRTSDFRCLQHMKDWQWMQINLAGATK